MKLLSAVLVFCLMFSSVSTVFAQDKSPVNWEMNAREQIRANILECNTYFSPKEAGHRINKSVGVKFAANTPESFEQSLDLVIKEKGLESLKKGHFYINAVDFESVKITEKRFKDILIKKGLKLNEVNLHVFSVPRHMIEKRAIKNANELFQQIKYFLPSWGKDVEAPIISEIVAGGAVTAALESYSIYYLLFESGMDSFHGQLTVATHMTLLATYEIFTKTLRNWWLRPGTSQFESYLKSVLSGIPFMLGFEIAPRFQKIVDFYNTNAWDEVMLKYGTELGGLFKENSVDMAFQGLFYYLTMSQGLGKWANTVEAKYSDKARVIFKWLSFPLLLLDAKFFAEMITSNDSLFQIMDYGINTGHIGLASITGIGALIAKNPRKLDYFLEFKKNVKRDVVIPLRKKVSKFRNFTSQRVTLSSRLFRRWMYKKSHVDVEDFYLSLLRRMNNKL